MQHVGCVNATRIHHQNSQTANSQNSARLVLPPTRTIAQQRDSDITTSQNHHIVPPLAPRNQTNAPRTTRQNAIQSSRTTNSSRSPRVFRTSIGHSTKLAQKPQQLLSPSMLYPAGNKKLTFEEKQFQRKLQKKSDVYILQ